MQSRREGREEKGNLPTNSPRILYKSSPFVDYLGLNNYLFPNLFILKNDWI